MSDDVRVVPATDAERYMRTEYDVWFPERDPGRTTADWLLGLPADRRFGAEVGDSETTSAAYAGIYGYYPLRLAVPGGGAATRVLDVSGLTWVGVHPDFRRRGVLTAMMRHHLEQARDSGYVASALHASEPVIYGRYGYGVASRDWEVTLGSGTTLTAPGLDAEAASLTVRMAAEGDDVDSRLMQVHESTLAHTVGAAQAEESFYRMMTAEWPESLRDREPRRYLFAQQDGVDVGVAFVRREHKWDKGKPDGKLNVGHLCGTPAARLALLRRLVAFDLIGSVVIGQIGVDDPLWQWVPSARSLGDAWQSEALWLRPLDLAGFLGSRGYDGACDVVVEVSDEIFPDNAGRWRIRIADGSASATRSSDPAELTLPIAVIGATYLGGTNLAALARDGVVTEHRPGAAGDLWRALRTDTAPQPTMGF